MHSYIQASHTNITYLGNSSICVLFCLVQLYDAALEQQLPLPHMLPAPVEPYKVSEDALSIWHPGDFQAVQMLKQRLDNEKNQVLSRLFILG